MASGVAVASSRLIASRSNALVAAADIERTTVTYGLARSNEHMRGARSH
jgi:hypothetical protein